jgi:hypothetical protein
MTIESNTLRRLREHLDEAADWGQRIEQFVADYGQLKPANVPSLSKEELKKLWWASPFAETGSFGLSEPNPNQLQGLRTMTSLLADRSKSLGDRFSSAREACEKTFPKAQLPVILRTLLILEGGLFGTIVTKNSTNRLLKWAGKPELDYREAASITLALENVRTLIEEWAPRVDATKIGERARIPWHLCEMIKEEGGETPPSVMTVPPASAAVAYWWMNANPKIWDFGALPIGGKETYTSHNDKGNKRRIYQHFLAAKPGDIVLGYVGQPQKEMVAVCRITQGLHQTKNGTEIEFEKTESLASPISYDTLQASVDLAKSEPFVNNLQGSLFRLTEQEYEIIRSLIDETNISVRTELENYDKKKAMKSLFLAEIQFDEMLAALAEKKNVVLQGAPGVGKTYIAKRLAYALIGSNDPQRVEMIQFHQSYSYEDFIQGFRPTPKGHFDLKYGIFHQFCRRAQREEAHGKPYVFIIDEINRGNLSKIFGELMMLIEPDKRGKEHAMPLAYSQDADERFYIPENLHLIGMMNTADRSLAMVDYALRRRFRFITLRPELSSEGFHSFLADAGAKPELIQKIVGRMTALNDAIAADTKNLGLAYQIGHSYFCPRNGIKLDDSWYHRVIESEIVPLIQEYWFDNEQKVKEQRSALLA